MMHSGMLASKFFRHITAADNKTYLLPSSMYYSEGELQPQAVKDLAERAVAATGKAAAVLTIAVIDGQAAWNLNSLAPILSPLNAQSGAMPAGVADLFCKLETTMDKIRPLVDTSAKVSSEFGQLLIKGCTTLNAGALVAMPTFYKALAPAYAAIPYNLYVSCGCFATGLLLGAAAGWAACIIIATSSRMLGRSVVLPLLQAQAAFNPESMDRVQRRRMKAGEFSNRWGETMIGWGMVVVATLSLLSLLSLVAGAYFGGMATLNLGPQ